MAVNVVTVCDTVCAIIYIFCIPFFAVIVVRIVKNISYRINRVMSGEVIILLSGSRRSTPILIIMTDIVITVIVITVADITAIRQAFGP